MDSNPFSKYLIGLVGGLGLFLLLPRALRFVIKNFLVGVAAEVVTVIVAGLLAKKAAGRIGDEF
jgi:hypothetical protein